MNTCKDCLCYEACGYHIDEETTMTVNECSTGFKHRDQYVKLPAYIGQRVWVPYVYWMSSSNVVYSAVREGKVSSLQQKVDRSWKIRVSINSSVSDYTVDEFNKYVFLSETGAEIERKKQAKELEAKYGV